MNNAAPAQTSDDALEGRIVNAQMRLQFGTREQRKAAWDEMAALIKMRSAERVATMEKDRGLTR